MTDEQLAEIRARLAGAVTNPISAPSIESRHIYSPRQAREDISALLAEVDRLRHCFVHSASGTSNEVVDVSFFKAGNIYD